ncbi:MAG: flagellar basal body-associated FliL family protein [Chitinispirillaceae bacterium]|nr:flagellar basal body-associated FliL family protein [Chitinispirillaceae bacterium]
MDENANINEGGTAVPSQVKTGGGNRYLMIGILAGVVVVNSLVAFMLIALTKPKSSDEIAAQAQADSVQQAARRLTSMGATTADAPIEAIVNIAGTDGDRFIKTAIIFEYDDKEYPDLGAELARRAPRFKNLLIDHLARLTLADVTEPDAKEKIRKDLSRLVNATLPPKMGEVREVLFTSFIIQ